MQVSPHSSDRERPENLVRRLAVRLSQHVLWDALLLVVPPTVALIYAILRFFQAGWLSYNAAILAAIISVALSVLGLWLWRRPRVPNVGSAARLMDQRSGAKDHFLTLATLDPAAQPASFVAWLRRQSERFLERVELKRDFPYRLKRSAYWSFGSSVVAAILIHLLLPLAPPGRDAAALRQRLREVAKQMMVKPDLQSLAEELEAVAARLEDPEVSDEEKQALARQMEQKIEEQQRKQEPEDQRDLLAQAASALSGQEQQKADGGQQQTEQQKGAGGIQTNAPQDGQGENQQSQGGSGEGKGESSPRLDQGMDQGKSSQANPKERGQARSSSNEVKDNQTRSDPNEPGKDPNKEKPGKTQGGAKEGAGKNQASEEPPPQGGSPVERFYKAGEGKEGLKAAGYVTVQLPEEIVADAKGESRATKDPKNTRTRTQVPVSNVPLPAHVPNAPTEKQPVPIEYRGIIR